MKNQWDTEIEKLRAENKKLKQMMKTHAEKCRGWAGCDPVWEQYLDFLKHDLKELEE